MRDIPKEESDEESTEVADDPDWVEEETTEVVDDPDWVEVNDDFESENEGSDNDRLYYLMKDSCKIFLGKLVPGDVLHNRVLQGSERKFLISLVIKAEKWEEFDEDRDMVGSYIAWDLKNTTLKVKETRPVAPLESIIPRETLLDYQKHFKDGCALVCLGSGLDECKYQNDKVYNEWDALQNAEPGPSPMKKRKRSKLDKKKENKRLKTEGKAYTTSKGVHKPARKPMQWVNCKCANKCSVNLSMEDRQMLYDQFGGIESDDQRRQYIVSHQISTVPRQTTTKGSSRRMQIVKYYFHGTNGEQVQVCPNVFHEK